MNSKEKILKLRDQLARLNEGREETRNGQIPRIEEELSKAYKDEERY